MTTPTAAYKSRGMTLVEMLVVLIIMIILVGGIAAAMNTYADGVRNQAAAQHANTVKKAARDYISDNYATLRSTAGPSTEATVSPAQLAAGGYLPAGFNPVNVFGQTFTVKVIEPTAGKLDAMVLTRGGDTIEGLDLRRIAQLIGVDGGYVDKAGTNVVAQGAFGGWSRNLAPFGGSVGAGKLATALFVTDATDQDDYLHRSATAGRPEFNRMNTALDMDGNDVDGARNIQATGTVYALGLNGRLTHTEGYMTIDSYSDSAYGVGSGRFWWNANAGTLTLTNTRGGNGNLTLDALAAQGNVTANGVVSRYDVNASRDVNAGGSLNGDVVSTKEAYTTGWFRSQGAGGWYSSRYGGGWHMTDPSWIRSYNNKSILTAGEVRGGGLRSTGWVQAAGNVTANGVVSRYDVNADRNVNVGRRLTAGEYLLPQGRAACNVSCPTNGLIGRTTAGQLTSCVSGTWRCMEFTSSGGGDDGGGGTTGGCLPDYPPTGCPVGYTPTVGGCRNDRTGMFIVCP